MQVSPKTIHCLWKSTKEEWGKMHVTILKKLLSLKLKTQMI